VQLIKLGYPSDFELTFNLAASHPSALGDFGVGKNRCLPFGCRDSIDNAVTTRPTRGLADAAVTDWMRQMLLLLLLLLPLAFIAYRPL